jgi:hypothetical protein
MSFTVHIDGNRVYATADLKPELQPDEFKTVGAHADAVAATYEVAGTDFSYKVDGDVAERDTKLSKVPDGALCELVEVTAPTEAAPAAAEEETELTEAGGDDEVAANDGTVDEVLARVGDDTELAQAALDAEQAKGDDARKTLVEGLEAVLDTE